MRSSVSVKPTKELNSGEVVMLVPILKPLVTSSSVMGLTPVMNMRSSHAVAGGKELEHVEEVAEEAFTVGGLAILVLAEGGKDGIGEVVVLVDDEIDAQAQAAGGIVEILQPRGSGGTAHQFFAETGLEQMFVVVGKLYELLRAMLLERLFQPSGCGVYGREVEPQYHELRPQGCGMLVYPPFAEELLEAVGVVDVIIGGQHIDEQRLAEPARTDKEEIAGFSLYQRNEMGLVHVITIVTSEALVVAQPVGDVFYAVLFHNSTVLLNA